MKNQEDLSPSPRRRSNRPGKNTSSARNLPIGVFDSGVGGLTVLKQLQACLPNESFLYFGDTANVPYGGRSAENLTDLTCRILDWMSHYPVKMAVMACNTSSALALEHVRHNYSFPILGIILPVAKAAPSLGRRIGVIATEGTVKSHCYAQAIQEVDSNVSVYQMACPEFVPLIEQGKINTAETRSVVETRLQPLLNENIDVLIYGCTHYPHLKKAIRDFLPESIQLVDPAVHISYAAQQELSFLRLHSTQGCPTTDYYVSSLPEQFEQQTLSLMGFRPVVKHITLGSQKTMTILS